MDLSSPEVWRWIWLLVSVAAAVGEIAVAGSFFLLPFAFGAAVAAGAAFLGLSVGAEWAAFLVSSAVTAAALRPLARRLDVASPRAAVGASRWEGREGYVLEDVVAGGGGLVRLDREQWRAESLTGAPIRAGSTVLVSRVDGTRLVVVPLEEPPLLEAPPSAEREQGAT
jgi:membrane protein implicated in regulation of membrane protease activity